MPLDPAGQIEFKQDDMHQARRNAGEPDDLVDLHRRGPKRFHDAVAIGFRRFFDGTGRRGAECARFEHRRMFQQW